MIRLHFFDLSSLSTRFWTLKVYTFNAHGGGGNRAQSIIAKTYLNRHHLRATTCIGLEAGHAASSQGPPGRCCGVKKCSRVLFFAPRLSLSYHSLPSLILALVQLEGLIYDGVTDPPVFIISNFMWNVEHFPIYVLSMASLPSSSI